MLFHVGSDSSNLFEDEKKTVADKYTQKVRHLLELKNKPKLFTEQYLKR